MPATSQHEFWKRLATWLPFSRPYFFPFERAVVSELLQALPPASREPAERQVERFNTVQRGGAWDMLLFGRFRFRKSRMPEAALRARQRQSGYRTLYTAAPRGRINCRQFLSE